MMKIILPQTDEKIVREYFQNSFFHRQKRIIKLRWNYLPCYLFELNFVSQKKQKRVFIICDALKGKIRRINWPQPYQLAPPEINSFRLDERDALHKVKEEVRWISFSSGLPLRKKYHLERINCLGRVGYPFWLVYFKKKGKYNFSVFDALSGKKEDFFGRDIFLAYFGLERAPTI